MDTTYKNLVIYYFSGTGNAKNAAIWFSNTAKERGIYTQLINIDRFDSVIIPPSNGRTLIGFFTPTHGFNLPPIMIDFLLKFPKKSSESDVFIVNTRAGMKLYKLFLPGLSGIAQYFAAIILKAKGYSVAGMQPLDMPSNWISLHPGIRKKVVISMHERFKKIMFKFANHLLDGKTRYKAFLSLPFDIAISPICVGYYFVGRFGLAKTFVASNKCTHCNLCLKECPTKSIIEVDQRMYWKFSCESCMRCLNSCPQKAIETCHGFTFAAWMLVSLVYGVLFSQLSLHFNLNSLLHFPYAELLVDWLLVLPFSIGFVGLMYCFNHFLMRYKIYNLLIEYTSLTKITGWRRYKAIKNF